MASIEPNQHGQGEERGLRSERDQAVSALAEARDDAAQLAEECVQLRKERDRHLMEARRAQSECKRLRNRLASRSKGPAPPDSDELHAAFADLQKLAEELAETNDTLRKVNTDLGTRVGERTRALSAANAVLKVERKQLDGARKAVERLNAELHRRVEEEVTARERAQAKLFQQQKLEAIGQLTGGMAHDFNNLLMVLTSGLYVIVGLDDREQRHTLGQKLQEAIGRGADLVRRLLAFGRREALRPEPTALGGLLEDLRGLLTSSLRGDIALDIDVAGDLWPINIDRGALELALLNLAVNARDALPQGGKVVVRARNATIEGRSGAEPGLERGDYVELSVIDNGTGMTREVLERSFEPFFTTKGLGQGTGLGLPQVYGFANQSGGAARIESAPGAGTAVTLLLPRSQGVVAQETRPDAPPEQPAPSSSILVLEDDQVVAELVSGLLRQLGHSPVHVTTAHDAMALIDENAVDLVFSDVLLANSASGIELAEMVASKRPDLPIVLTTGYSGQIGQKMSHTRFPLLRKPYSTEDLRRVINRELARKAHKKPTWH